MSQSLVTVPARPSDVSGPRTTTLPRLDSRRAAVVEDLHRSPPITWREIRRWSPWLVPAAVTLFALLGVVASVDGGTMLAWDRPITDAFVAARGPAIDRVALWISRLGSTPVVLAAGAAGVALAARRCRTVALVMLVVVLMRPGLEWLIKDVVARPRPSGARLVPGTGYSFPSGHVLAAAATWGFVPVIAGLYIRRRWLWWTLAGLAGAIIVLVAWSRVWLGVHWASDVAGSLALAFVALSAAEVMIDRGHGPGRAGRPRTPSCCGRSSDP
ncbi:MAG: phosphatase PAP2 family protein [Acidimicrobiales bacterium]